MLPKPKSKLGYSADEISKICRDRKIKTNKFWKAFGVNTCVIENGESRYYACDVENALYKLKAKDGKFYMWD